MEIITRLDVLDLSEESIEALSRGDTKQAIEEVFSALDSAMTEQDGNVYLYEDYSPENYAFGKLQPEYIRACAKRWLLEIQNEFLAALDGFTTETGNLPRAEDLPVDNNETWRMSLAARELDNVWHPYSRHAVYLENACGFPYLKVQLSKDEELHMIQHPDEYIIAKVYVQD